MFHMIILVGHTSSMFQVNRRILRAWRESVSREATLGRLARVLWECEAYDAVIELGSL